MGPPFSPSSSIPKPRTESNIHRRRMAFYIQVRQLVDLQSARSYTAERNAKIPFFLFAIATVATRVNIQLPEEVRSQSLSEKLRRIDFLGSITLAGSVGCMLLGFSMKTTDEIPWGSPVIIGLFTGSALFTVAFILVEAFWAPYPVMPLRLISQRTPLAVSIANLLASMTAFSMVGCRVLSSIYTRTHDHDTALQRTSGKSSPLLPCYLKNNATLVQYFSAVRMETAATAGGSESASGGV